MVVVLLIFMRSILVWFVRLWCLLFFLCLWFLVVFWFLFKSLVLLIELWFWNVKWCRFYFMERVFMFFLMINLKLFLSFWMVLLMLVVMIFVFFIFVVWFILKWGELKRFVWIFWRELRWNLLVFFSIFLLIVCWREFRVEVVNCWRRCEFLFGNKLRCVWRFIELFVMSDLELLKIRFYEN